MGAIATTDYDRLREDVGLADRSERGKLLLTGADVADFLQGQLTNDVEALAPGTGCYAALLTHKGKLRADLRALRGEGWFLLDCEPIGLVPLRRTFETYSLGRDVTVRDETAERAILSLVGPRARAALEAAPADGEHSFVEGEHGLYVATDAGVDVVCPAAEADGVATAVGVDRVSAAAAECVRIETGRPRHGLDMDADTIPEEAGLKERAVSFTKGCYVGQETVARLHYRGRPNRHLRGLRMSEPASTGDTVTAGDKQVGRIGSTCVSPRHGPIALAILRREVVPGDEVEVARPDRRAEVVELPFDRAR